MNTSKRRERRYRLTQERFDSLFAEQNGLCAICSERPPCDVDHDKKTGIFRGLLCRSCNLGLGMFSDNPEKMQRAIAYLQRPAQRLADRFPIECVGWQGPYRQERGEKNHNAKLTNEEVRRLRSEYASGGISYRELGQKYSLHPVHVGRIIRRVEWTHVQ
jgi:hypothetical protein